MELIFNHYSFTVWLFAIAVAFFAGLVKGLVGFAMPMIIISGLSTILEPLVAIAAMLVPTLITNFSQAFAQGFVAAREAIWFIRRYLVISAIILVAASQIAGVISDSALLFAIGLLICFFSMMQMFGAQLKVPVHRAHILEPFFAVLSGFFGGLAGIWGPPLVVYLTSINTPKDLQIRAQGIAFGLGAALLGMAHLRSGVLNAHTIPLSIVLVVPALIGMVISQSFQTHIDQRQFRKMTLIVLLIAGLNLLRRSYYGIV